MTAICPRDRCTGCAACINICPQECINMISDTEGFLYPVVDQERCTNCGFCRDICPILHIDELDLRVPQKVYACWNNDEETRFRSSSGGAFSALAEHVLGEGGVVFGAAFDDDMKVKHVFISKKEELQQLRGSKYVQSDIGYTYLEVKKFLEQERKVLFSGTPCQVAALYAIIGKQSENLLTCDLLCKGVPSPGLFAKYVGYLEQRFKAKLGGINFRSKHRGWEVRSTAAVFNNGRQHILRDANDSFYYGFSQNLTLRCSCYQCPYASIKRNGDITLGDFWGIGDSFLFDHDTKNGVSVVLVNSEKGHRVLCVLGENAPQLYLEERIIREAQAMRALSHPWQEPKKRNALFSDYQRLEYKELAKIHILDKGIKRLLKLVIPPTTIYYLRRYLRKYKK